MNYSPCGYKELETTENVKRASYTFFEILVFVVVISFQPLDEKFMTEFMHLSDIYFPWSILLPSEMTAHSFVFFSMFLIICFEILMEFKFSSFAL